MLTLDDQIAVMRQNAAYGLTGKHALGRGFERVNGSYTEEDKTNHEPVVASETHDYVIRRRWDDNKKRYIPVEGPK